MKKRNEISIEEVRERFSYDPETGVLTRRDTGAVAGSLGTDGYLKCRSEGQFFYVHRLAWAHHYGYWPAEIDHKDRDKANNRLKNMRECTRAQNQQNRGAFKNNRTGVKGVFRVKDRFRATIRLNGKQIYIGQFKTLAEAAEARRLAETPVA